MRYHTHKYVGKTARELAPEVVLIGAILRQAVQDAQRLRGEDATHAGTSSTDRKAAQAFLTDRAQLAWWCELMGADVDAVQPQLLRAAGIQPTDTKGAVCPRSPSR